VKVRTGVTGGAARVGHALVLVVGEWSASLASAGDGQEQIVFRAAAGSLAVESGSGGLRPLSTLDKEMIQRNCARTLRVKEHPDITFTSSSLKRGADGLDVAGVLTILGESREVSWRMSLTNEGRDWRAIGRLDIVQSDFGVKPYSLMLGQLRVADPVTIDIDLRLPGELL
jgi:hypothetical protein